MSDLDKLVSWLKDVSRRSERVEPFGDRDAQRQISTPVDIAGIEDIALLTNVPTDTFLAGDGYARVGEYPL